MRSLKTFLFVAGLLAVAGAIALRFLLGQLAGSEEFKRFAETRVGEYLKAKVSIGRIRPHRFDQIALENIIIESSASRDGSQLVRVDRLIFRYHLNQLWKKKFEVPTGVVLRNPSILIDQDKFPYQYFGEAGRGSGFSIPAIDFKGGEIRYRLPGLRKDILLTGVEGRVDPADVRNVRVAIRAKASGVLDGSVSVHGIVNTVANTHDLWLELDRMEFARDIHIPFKTISGKVRWTGKDLFFNGLETSLYGWLADLSGSFENREGKPKTTVHLRVGKERSWARLDLVLDLSEQLLDGDAQLTGQPPFGFRGKVWSDGKRFVAESLLLNQVYQGKGEIDLTTGNYEISVEKGRKRVSVFSNTRGLNFAVHARLDHLKIFGMDLVTQARVYLHALSGRWDERQFRFKGDLETDYFILNEQPFQDLKGSFEVNPRGVTGIQCDWGRKFQISGQVAAPWKDLQADLTLRVADFDLGNVQFLASKPLPKELGGMLSGKVFFEGALKRPEVIAAFNIRDGKWGKVEYERGIIQFRGFSPYFPLKDSKIWKGRTTLFLTGAVDLSLDNILAGVKIETPDSLVLWKGLEVALHKKERTMSVSGKGFGEGENLPALEVASSERGTAESGPSGQSREDEKNVTIGSSLKF